MEHILVLSIIFCHLTILFSEFAEADDKKAPANDREVSSSSAFTTVATATAGIASSVAAYWGFAATAATVCSAGVCPLVTVAGTGAAGLVSMSGLGGAAAASAYAGLGGVCADGLTSSCASTLGAIALVGAGAAYLGVKGLDRLRKANLRRTRMLAYERESALAAPASTGEVSSERDHKMHIAPHAAAPTESLVSTTTQPAT